MPPRSALANCILRWDAICSEVLRSLYGADCYAYGLVASGFGADLVIEVCVCARAHTRDRDVRAQAVVVVGAVVGAMIAFFAGVAVVVFLLAHFWCMCISVSFLVHMRARMILTIFTHRPTWGYTTTAHLCR